MLNVKILPASYFEKSYKGFFVCIYDKYVEDWIIPDWVERGYTELDRNFNTKRQAANAALDAGFEIIGGDYE